MLLKFYKLNVFLLVIFITAVINFTVSKDTSASELSDIDLNERKGYLDPANTKVTNYEFGMSCQEHQEHTWYVSQNYLDLAREWDLNKPIPSVLAKAIGSSFTWVTLLQPSLSSEYEPIINNLVQRGLLNVDSLWINGLLQTIVEYIENGSMRIIGEGPLQFKGRMLSSFTGSMLFIGGKHSTNFPATDYYTLDCDTSQNPDVVGNANNISHIQQFPDNRFTNIIFDHIGHVLLLDKDLIKEYARILKSGGKILFKTEHADEEYTESVFKKNKNEMRLNLQSAGFKNIEINKNKDTENEEYAEYPWFMLITANI